MPTRPPLHRQPRGPGPTPHPVRPEDTFYASKPWRALRLAVLTRDGFTCRASLAGCTGTAEMVHHVQARRQGGTDSPENLQSVCKSCHNRLHPEKGRFAG